MQVSVKTSQNVRPYWRRGALTPGSTSSLSSRSWQHSSLGSKSSNHFTIPPSVCQPLYFTLILWFLCMFGCGVADRTSLGIWQILWNVFPENSHTHIILYPSNITGFTDQRSIHRTPYSKWWLFDFTLKLNWIIQ